MTGSQASRARVARRIATAAAYGGGGLGLLGVGLAGVLLTESRMAIRAIGVLEGDPPRADGLYGEGFADPADRRRPLVLAFLGDSTAAGLGVQRAQETPGALLASGLASVAERRVQLVNVAKSGARSSDLARQLALVSALPHRPDVAVVMIGANDVTRHAPAARSVRELGEAVGALVSAGCHVVVGTCPDLGTIKPVRPPLRWVARRLSRQLAAAQTIAVVEAGGRTVSLGSLLGPEFATRPELFAADRYHPSAQGYATASMALLPSLCAALGLWPQESPEAGGAVEPQAVLPVAVAAAAAAGRSGTEVTAAGPANGTWRWATLKQRFRLALPHGADAEPDAEPGGESTGAGPTELAGGGGPRAITSANSHPEADDAGATKR
ncbi:lipase [Kitasatospora phosalacinea]|uniref:Lipase n=1 Tax=Kitasatospora phosalacinea TaxID=2065 RepID=A0A9W6QFD3_9ACTN|nr:SGNH/GDSL hydrolase family protein [Kitasatospora phosalacinea]GLW74561.1 lipase [Kitasatospora phosalacinea]